MNEDDARKYADGLLECQRLVIAKATLAGCRFVPRTVREWPGERSRHRRDVTYYEVSLPDGQCVGTDFRDMYEAACCAVAMLDHTHVVHPTEGLFALREDNAMPPDEDRMTNNNTRGFDWAALRALRKVNP